MKADHQKLPTKYNLPLTSDKLLRVWLSKFEAPQTIFMAIFELSMVENPSEQRIEFRIEFRNF